MMRETTCVLYSVAIMSIVSSDILTRGEDVYGETYGQTSQCVRQGRAWEKTFTVGGTTRTLSNVQYGGGCYRVSLWNTAGL